MSLLVISYPEFKTEDFDLIQSWRKKYYSEFLDVIDPHFTLIFPIEHISYETLLNHIKKESESFLKIELVINRAKVHKNKIERESYLFLVPGRGFDEIIRLHDKLYSGILEKELRIDLPYIPHITIGMFEKEESCKSTANQLNELEFSIKANLNSLSIVDNRNNRVKLLTNIDLL